MGSNEFLFAKQGNLVQFSFQLVQSSDSGHLLSHKRLRGSLNVASVEIHVRDCGSFLFSNWLFRDSKFFQLLTKCNLVIRCSFQFEMSNQKLYIRGCVLYSEGGE